MLWGKVTEVTSNDYWDGFYFQNQYF